MLNLLQETSMMSPLENEPLEHSEVRPTWTAER